MKPIVVETPRIHDGMGRYDAFQVRYHARFETHSGELCSLFCFCFFFCSAILSLFSPPTFSQDFAITITQGAETQVQLVDPETLPVVLKLRVQKLFEFKRRWTLAELTPFVAPLIPPNIKVEEALRPLTRISNDDKQPDLLWFTWR